MSAIYQRARPIRWDEVVGQEHVKDVLRAALERGRLGHAYLFSGPRGVGKTTTARLIAMTANCESGPVKPCGECASCLAVRSGSHPDVLEIDAASNNSVDDVRELREKVGLSAMRGGKKIYILDEAHMMSRAAFNALLKTLEEPPPHVIFVLATTEPEKVLPTILSRCQHYRFRRLSEGEIAGKLAGLCEREGVSAEPGALQLIGRLADGAMRDGESLLERMLAVGGSVTRAGVEAALGLPPSELVAHMARALAMGEAEPLLSGAGQLYQEGYAARSVVDGLKAALREALHASLGLGEGAPIEGAEVPRLLKLQAALDEQESRFARGADLMSLELALTHALLAGALPSPASSPASAPSNAAGDLGARLTKLERELAALKSSGVRAEPAAAGAAQPEVPDFNPAARGPRSSSGPASPSGANTPEATPTRAAPQPEGTWPDVLRHADIKMRALLKVARVNPVNGGLVIVYDERHKFHAKQVLEKFDELAGLVVKVYGGVDVELVTPEGSKKKSGRSSGTGEPAPTLRVATVGEVAREAVRQISAPAQRAPSPPPQPPEVPDFSPRRGAARAPASAEAAETLVMPPADSAPATSTTPLPEPATPAPSPEPPSPGLLDPEPIMQEPVWDDAPPPAELLPARGAARVPPPVDTPWSELGRGEEAPPVQASSSPVGPAGQRAGGRGGGNVRAHPLFQEATRLFAGRVREAGVLKRKAPAVEGEDVEAAESEGEVVTDAGS